MKIIRKILDNKIFMLAISFVCAFALWFYVNGVYDPQDVKEFKDIPVSVSLENSVPAQNNLTILEMVDASINVKVSGSRVALANLSKDDITAKVVMDNVTMVGIYDLPISVTLPGTGLSVSEQSLGSISISFDKAESKQVEAEIVSTGSVPDGYVLSDITVSPASVTVNGPAALVNKIDSFLIEVDVEGQTAVKTLRQSVIFVGENGETIESRYLVSDVSTVSVNVPIYFIKEVPLAVTVINKSGGSDEAFFSYEMEPASLRIAGPKGDVDLLNQLLVNTFDTSEIEGAGVKDLEVKPPNGIMVLDDVQSVKMRYRLDGSVTRKYSVTAIESKDDSRSVKMLDSSVDIRVRGKAADIESLNASDIRAIVDVSAVSTTGTAEVPVTFTFPEGKNVAVIGQYKVKVQID